MFQLTNGILIIKVGDFGTSVNYIQELLNIKQDSSFGKKTKAAVLAFQRANSLQADGVVGPTTFIKLSKSKIRILFYRNNKSLEIQLVNSHSSGISKIFECEANSGLPKGHSRISELIKKGRKDLDFRTNYMQSKYDDVSDVGPIPNGGYELKLSSGMPYQKTGGGWGIGGWYLDPGFLQRGLYKFGYSRGGFFLHHDGNGVGTGGCIGVKHGNKMRSIRKILTAYHEISLSDNIDITVH